MKSYASLFTGFGGADIGAMAAGYTPAWGVEYRADIAEVANANLGGHVQIADILNCDPRDYARVDLLHASPPCPNFSVANAGRGETTHDLALAAKVTEFVTVLRPQAFTLENVRAYRESQSWRLIEATLWEAGYWLQVENVNAADFGVPQTRRRMIARAVLGGWTPYLPPAVPWVGWYAAIEDILDTLPESRFAPWQLARLPALVDGSFYSVAQQSDDHKGSETGYGCPRRSTEEPAFTVTTQTPSWFKAFLLMTEHHTPSPYGREGRKGIIPPDEPSNTIVTGSYGQARIFLVTNQYGQPNDSAEQGKPGVGVSMINEPMRAITTSALGNNRAWLDTGRVVAMTPRALARFQSFPDWYELPAKRSLVALGIGNSVPPLLYQRIAEAFDV